MATLTEPATTGPSGTLFRALRSVDVDPDLGLTAPTMRSPPRPARTSLLLLGVKIDSQSAQIKIVGRRMDMLQKVIWSLIGLLLQGRHPVRKAPR